ncbi:MAG: tail fiber protein [Chloroflexota bacterium]
MTTPFLGEIRMFAGTFAPVGWALCDGQLINVTDNEALFSVIGSTYGGDGRVTFGLPDMRGRVPLGQGSGLALTPRSMGAQGGSETEGLTASHIPNHTHALQGSTNAATGTSGNGTVLAASSSLQPYRPDDADVNLASEAIGDSGGTGSNHDNMMPALVINYIIATVGLIPSQT